MQDVALHGGGRGAQPHHLVFPSDPPAAGVDRGRGQDEGEQDQQEAVEPAAPVDIPQHRRRGDDERGPRGDEPRLPDGAQRRCRPGQEHQKSEEPHLGAGQDAEGLHQGRQRHHGRDQFGVARRLDGLEGFGGSLPEATGHERSQAGGDLLELYSDRGVLRASRRADTRLNRPGPSKRLTEEAAPGPPGRRWQPTGRGCVPPSSSWPAEHASGRSVG